MWNELILSYLRCRQEVYIFWVLSGVVFELLEFTFFCKYSAPLFNCNIFHDSCVEFWGCCSSFVLHFFLGITLFFDLHASCIIGFSCCLFCFYATVILRMNHLKLVMTARTRLKSLLLALVDWSDEATLKLCKSFLSSWWIFHLPT